MGGRGVVAEASEPFGGAEQRSASTELPPAPLPGRRPGLARVAQGGDDPLADAVDGLIVAERRQRRQWGLGPDQAGGDGGKVALLLVDRSQRGIGETEGPVVRGGGTGRARVEGEDLGAANAASIWRGVARGIG